MKICSFHYLITLVGALLFTTLNTFVYYYFTFLYELWGVILSWVTLNLFGGLLFFVIGFPWVYLVVLPLLHFLLFTILPSWVLQGNLVLWFVGLFLSLIHIQMCIRDRCRQLVKLAVIVFNTRTFCCHIFLLVTTFLIFN